MPDDEPKTGRTGLVRGPLLRLVVLRVVGEGSIVAATGDELFLRRARVPFQFRPNSLCEPACRFEWESIWQVRFLLPPMPWMGLLVVWWSLETKQFFVELPRLLELPKAAKLRHDCVVAESISQVGEAAIQNRCGVYLKHWLMRGSWRLLA